MEQVLLNLVHRYSHYWNTATKSYGPSQTANLLPLYLDITPTELVPAATSAYVDAVQAHGNHTNSGAVALELNEQHSHAITGRPDTTQLNAAARYYWRGLYAADLKEGRAGGLSLDHRDRDHHAVLGLHGSARPWHGSEPTLPRPRPV